MKSLIDIYKKKCLAPFIFSSLPEKYAIMRSSPKDINANTIIYSILECKWNRIERVKAEMTIDGRVVSSTSCKIEYTNDYIIFVNISSDFDGITSISITRNKKMMYIEGNFIKDIESPLVELLLRCTTITCPPFASFAPQAPAPLII